MAMTGSGSSHLGSVEVIERFNGAFLGRGIEF